MSAELFNIPNLLTLSRIPLAAGLFACIATEAWLGGLLLFLVASLTDWLDGVLARRWNQLTAFGRTFDPLIDKILIGGAFIYLVLVPSSGLLPWMVTVVIGREILITGVRGYLESLGIRFGADWFGKLKMFLQCIFLVVFLVIETLRSREFTADWLNQGQTVLLWAMLLATIGSGVQYLARAVSLVRSLPSSTSSV